MAQPPQANHRKRIASFDIFDTVLTRAVGEPRALFLLLGERLHRQELISASAESFARHRTEAEIRSFRNGGGLDSNVTIETIHTELRHSMGVADHLADRLIDAELELELELLTPFRTGIEKLADARTSFDKIIFVSDMYLPSEFLRKALAKHEILREDDDLFVSCELERSKASGKIWDVVASQIGVEPAQIRHFGNDHRSDGNRAKRAGITPLVLPQGNLNRFEQTLEKWSFHTGGLSSLIAGASRLARDEANPRSSNDQALVDIATGVAAPFLIGKVLWVLHDALERDIDHLYFVARDGQVLLALAEELAPKVGYEGAMTYLSGSRQAWALPSITESNFVVLDNLCPDDGDVRGLTLRGLFDRLRLAPEDVVDELTSAGFGPDSWDVALELAQRRNLRRMLSDDEDLRNAIVAAAEPARDMLIRYLEQKGLFASSNPGIIDLGTGATMYNALSAVLATKDCAPPRGYYFAIRSDVVDNGFGIPEAYVRNEQNKTGFMRTPGFLTFLEMICTADHGSVVGYREVNGEVVPVLTRQKNEEVLQWGLPTVHDAIATTGRMLHLDPATSLAAVDLRPAALEVFEQFWAGPSQSEASAWGRYPFEDGWGQHADSFNIAARTGFVDAVKGNPQRHWWQAGSEQLSPLLPRTIMKTRRTAVELTREAQRKLSR